MPKRLVTMLLDKNKLSGEIPGHFGELSQLQHLDLSYNLLQGTPPISVFALPKISYVNLASNELTVSFPVSLTCSSQLGFVDISANILVERLPSCLSSNSNNKFVKLDGNYLTVDSLHQHEASYCQTHSKKKFLKLKSLVLLVAVIGGDPCGKSWKGISCSGSSVIEIKLSGPWNWRTIKVQGRIVEICGREASGKTTLALHIVKEAQKLGGYYAYLAVENLIDSSLVEAMGVDTENLVVARPNSAKNTLNRNEV